MMSVVARLGNTVTGLKYLVWILARRFFRGHASYMAHDFIRLIIIARKDIHAFVLFEIFLSQHEGTPVMDGSTTRVALPTKEAREIQRRLSVK